MSKSQKAEQQKQADAQKAEEQKAEALRAEIKKLEADKAQAEKALAEVEKAQVDAHKPKKLKASQIKSMLAPLIGFMPAMMASGDIVYSAEQAEAELAEFDNKKAAIQKEIDDFNARKVDYEKQFLGARDAYHKEIDPLEAKKLELKDAVSKLYTERDSLAAEIESVRATGTKEIQAEHDKLRKDLEADRKAFAAQIEQEKADAVSQFTKVQKDFAAFKSAHNLG